MKVPFFDRTRADAAQEEELVAAFRRVMKSGRYILGPEVEALEAACCSLLGAARAVGVSSCSDALLVALMALGVGPGDEVICPAFTFFATAGSIARLGARPVFADVRPGCLTLDPTDVLRRLTPKTKGILAVHLFGLLADLPALSAIAREHRLFLVEDCAQAMGAEVAGAHAGTTGAFGCFSFFPTKNVGGFGDAGLLTTNDPGLDARARQIRVHGSGTKNHHERLGGNFRIDALQAALLLVKLRGLGDAIARRRGNAAIYDKIFAERGLVSDNPDDGPLYLGDRPREHTFNQYILRARGAGVRDALRAFLAERGVATEVYYPLALPFQHAFDSLGHAPGDFPVAEAAAREALALPIFPELTGEEVACTAAQVAAFFATQRAEP